MTINDLWVGKAGCSAGCLLHYLEEGRLSIGRAEMWRNDGRLQLIKEEKEILAGMRFNFTRYTENDLEEGEIYLYPLDPDDKVWGFYPAEFDKNDLH